MDDELADEQTRAVFLALDDADRRHRVAVEEARLAPLKEALFRALHATVRPVAHDGLSVSVPFGNTTLHLLVRFLNEVVDCVMDERVSMPPDYMRLVCADDQSSILRLALMLRAFYQVTVRLFCPVSGMPESLRGIVVFFLVCVVT
jgi:hypothetical protein